MIALLACSEAELPLLGIYASPELYPVVNEHVQSLPHATSVVVGSEVDGRADAQLETVIELDDSCEECFTVVADGESFRVSAGGTAGALYGLAALMEAHGWRFAHPFDTDVPEAPTLDADFELGAEQGPEIARRGLHLHTLHPTEAMFDLWAEPDVARSTLMLDWIVRNRGNHVQWPGLDDIAGNEQVAENWREPTRLVVDAAHRRGMTAGVGVQLFGMSNLQLAYDLVDDEGTEAEDKAAMEARWPIVMDAIAWDTVSLSFGEFFAADPDTFISRVELAYDTLQAVAPGVEMTGTIHVGGNEEVQVEYDGKEMSYYFLVDYADRPITPWVHSVMYYNLYEDAGGAYGLDEFTEHREFLETKLSQGEAVGYHPETAYWVAFDNSVPTYMPVYIQSRWHDLDQLRQRGLSLQDHVIFESGWEWGYWQNDAAALRMSYTLRESPEAQVAELFADDGLAAAVGEIMAVQHEALITNRLAPYLAGRDIAMDVGEGLEIVSQPRRVLFEEVLEMSAEARDTFEGVVVKPLLALGDAHVEAAGALGDGDRWTDEVTDGLTMDGSRAAYVAALYTALLQHARGEDPTLFLDAADVFLEVATDQVANRYASFHDPISERLVERIENPTIYDYGYLHNAQTLCFWQRERGEARELILGEPWTDPGCTL